MPGETELTLLKFPSGGLERRAAYNEQSPSSTPDSVNIWPDDSTHERERGGVRPGTQKAYDTDTGTRSSMIADVLYVSSGVLHNRVVVSANGNLFYDNEPDLIQVTTLVGLAFDKPLGYADIQSKLYITGDNSAARNVCVFNPATNTLLLLVASAGTVPTKCSLVCNFNNRLVLAGDEDNPQNWYMSKQGDPTNFDYGNNTSQAAASSNNTDQGRLGEDVRALIPHSQECMFFGLNSSFWSMQGDIMAGGKLVKLSDNIGVIDSRSWCYDSEGMLYFLSRDGLYCMPPGCGTTPRSVSREKIPEELLNINRDDYTVSMAYDRRYRGILLSICRKVLTFPSYCYWIDTKQSASGDAGGPAASFWRVLFGDSDHHVMDLFSLRDDPITGTTASSMLMGCRDGYVRRFNRSVTNDDGTAIAAYIDYGPIPFNVTGQDGMLQKLQATLGTGSGSVLCSVRAGRSAEEAYASTKVVNKTFPSEGLNRTFYPRVRGYAGLIRLANVAGSTFSIEELLVGRTPLGNRKP